MIDAVYQTRAADLAEAAEYVIEALSHCKAPCPESEAIRIAMAGQQIRVAIDRFRAAEKLLKELSA